MTKTGYTHIIVPTELHAQLKTLAKEDKVSIAQKIAHLINGASESSINTGINTKPKPNPKPGDSELQSSQSTRKETENGFSLASSSLLVKEKTMWTEGDLNPRLPRCERGDHTRLIYRPFVLLFKNGFEYRI